MKQRKNSQSLIERQNSRNWSDPQYQQAYEEYKEGLVDANAMEIVVTPYGSPSRTPKESPGADTVVTGMEEDSVINAFGKRQRDKNNDDIDNEREVKRPMLEEENKTLKDRVKELELALQTKEKKVKKNLVKTLSNNGKPITRNKYVGQMNMLNRPHGEGVMTFDNGCTYDGE